MDTIAPFSVYPSQNKVRIITGQKVAAIPDQPKMINQKTVLSGDKTDTSNATANAKNAKINVTFFERFIDPTIDYASYSLQKNYPKTASVIEKLIKPKIVAKKEQLDLLDSGLFRRYRKYMIYLFQKK